MCIGTFSTFTANNLFEGFGRASRIYVCTYGAMLSCVPGLESKKPKILCLFDGSTTKERSDEGSTTCIASMAIQSKDRVYKQYGVHTTESRRLEGVYMLSVAQQHEAELREATVR